MEHQYKEVYFSVFCELCKHKDVKEEDLPCADCLVETVNVFSHRPVKFEAKEDK